MADTKTPEQIEPGDRVWVGDGRNPRRKLRAVEKVTPTQIVTEGKWRYRRKDFRLIGTTAFGAEWIKGVATPEEVEAWEAERAAEKRDAERRRLADEARLAKRKGLCDLLPGEAYARTSDEADGSWEVVIPNLTEERVRRLAELLGSAGLE